MMMPMDPDGPRKKKTRVMVVDDHDLMRTMLGLFIDSEPAMMVCGAARSGEEALATIDSLRPDLMLVDVSLHGMSGLELVGIVSERWPALPCVMLSGHAEERYVRQAIEAGARGYLVKGTPEQLAPAVRVVLGGGTFISSAVRRELPL